VGCSVNGRRRRRSNKEITLTCYSDIMANRNLGCRNALAQRFRIDLPIRSYFRGLFCLTEDGTIKSVRQAVIYIFILNTRQRDI